MRRPDPTSRLGYTFWILCSMEMWERLAYYGLRVVVWIYVAQADEPGGLHFTQAQKGLLLLLWTIFQSVLPTFTGGLSDRYGYKKTIAWAIVLKIAGYVLMGSLRSFPGFLLGVLLLASGTAIFKPGIQGSLAHTMDRSNSSKGWGIFYWLVNVGSLIGGFLAGALRAVSWPMVFYGCAAIVAINFIMLFTYKEIESGADKTEPFGQVMARTFKNLLEPRLMTFLLILSGFWFMMYQLWDLHPNFVTDWIDSSSIVNAVSLPDYWVNEADRGGQVRQEILLNINALMIVLLMVPIAILSGRMKTLHAMILGMSVAVASILVSGLTQSGWVFCLGVVLFSLGEMLTGPKKNEYLALIAPPGKKGLYLGYVNIPVGIGAGVGGFIASVLYGRWGEKAGLAQKHLASLGHEVPPRPEAYDRLIEVTGLTSTEATQLLWDTYDPWLVWIPIAAVGVVSMLALVLFARKARQWADMNH